MVRTNWDCKQFYLPVESTHILLNSSKFLSMVFTGGVPKYEWSPLLFFWKRGASIILKAQRTSRTVTLFNSLSWIPFYNEVYTKRCELAFKRINGCQLPDYLRASLRKNSGVDSRNTRNCNVNLLCPLHRNISEGGRTFAVRTVKDWNNLPRSLKTRRSLKSFKAELWKIVLNSQKSKGSFDLN